MEEKFEDKTKFKDNLFLARFSESTIIAYCKRFLDEVECPHIHAKQLSDIIYARYMVEDYALGSPEYVHGVTDFMWNVLHPHKVEVYRAGCEIAELPIFKEKHMRMNTFMLQLILHDISKYSFVEALGYHVLNGSKKDGKEMTELAQKWFDEAWHHHKHNNPHHPEYWFSVGKDGATTALEMPTEYVFEMVADWIGASRSYGGDISEWVPANIDRFSFHPATRMLVVEICDALGIIV